MTATVKSIRGSQGKWDVDVTYSDGSRETLPTAHRYFWKGGDVYHRGDPDISWPIFRDKPQFEEHVNLIKEKRRVVVTTDDIDEATGMFKRTGYVGVFDVDGISVTKDGLTFRFVRRLPE
jgi:hypothetical protein